MWPPSLLRIHIQEQKRRKISLWLPVFLLWPLAAALAAVLAPPVLVLALAGWSVAKRVVLLAPAAADVLCSLRGLRVHVNGQDGDVTIAFF